MGNIQYSGGELIARSGVLRRDSLNKLVDYASIFCTTHYHINHKDFINTGVASILFFLNEKK